jgi:thermopsin
MSIRLAAVVIVVVALTLVSFGSLVASPVAARAALAAVLPTSSPSTSVAPATSPASSSGPEPASDRAALTQGILQHLRDAKVPMTAAYLPNLLAQVRVSNGLVQPLYTVGPAPMGIGDFGVRNTTGTPTGYILQSTGWRGVLTLNDANALYLNSGVPDWFGAQLNTVMTNTTVMGHTTYRYWIQNVIQYSSLTHSLTFLDNIWNFSNPSAFEPASTFYSFCPSNNGGPVPPVFYYCFGPTYTVPFPFTVYLYENSSLTTNATTHQVWSTVSFGYDIVNATGVSIASGIYDTVLFNSNVTTASSPPTPKFTVNGFQLNPVGLLDDSELMIGGPGGGSTTTLFAIDGTAQLQYLNTGTGKYVNDPTAWNEGTDTGETSEGISEYWTADGTVHLSPGPSIPMPFWNATPGGNKGQAVLQGNVTPSNSFFFINQGSTYNEAQAAWAPVPASGKYSWAMPPGTYFVRTLASEYDENDTDVSLVAGTNFYDVQMAFDPSMGVYAPLWAWNNEQLANISSSGTGSAGDPYEIYNNQYGAMDPVFGEFNDFFFPVFSGIFLAYTTAHVDIQHAASFYVGYPASYSRSLTRFGLPNSNDLGIQAYYASSISIWQSTFTGWFSGFLFGGGIYAPIANIGWWGVTDSLIGNNVFTNQGSALLTSMGGNNVIWGNTILSGPELGTFYPAPFQFGIQVIESSDLIYNNYVSSSLPGGILAYAPNSNFLTGLPQVNQNDWNLSTIQPASQVKTVNGYGLSGSIVGSSWQCGNFWGDFVPGSPLPYNETGFIATGGDYCPYPLDTYSLTFVESGLSAGTWSVSAAGVTKSAPAGVNISFVVPNGTWDYSVAAVEGYTVDPANGTVLVAGAPVVVAITIANGLVSVASVPSATDIGQDTSFSVAPSGGTGTYTFEWAFGDGNTSTDQFPTYTYDRTGTFNVTVWTNDTSGASVTETDPIDVNPLPTATASATPTTADVGQVVRFDAHVVGGSTPYGVLWTFADGSLSTVVSPTHAFGTPGTYHVTFTATDAIGVAVTQAILVTVNAVPVASASASTNAPATGDTVTFTGSVSGGSAPFTYTWSLGDGSTSSSQNPTHAYGSTGTYTVHLWVNDSAGGSSQTTITVVVSPPASTVMTTTTGAALGGAALIIGLIVGALLMTLLSRRRKGEAKPPESGEEPKPPAP